MPAVPVAWKPYSVEMPAPTWPLYGTFVQFVVPVLPLRLAFHAPVTVAPDGRPI